MQKGDRLHPAENAADKQQNKGDGQQVSDDTHRQIAIPGQSQPKAEHQRSSKFKKRQQGTEKNAGILHQLIEHRDDSFSFHTKIRGKTALASYFIIFCPVMQGFKREIHLFLHKKAVRCAGFSIPACREGTPISKKPIL